MMKMYFLEISFVSLCFIGMYSASVCVYSENIECTCAKNSVICTGIQEEFSEVQKLLENVSITYSSTDLLYLSLDVRNLTFQPEFTFSNFTLSNLSLANGLKTLHDDLFSGLGSSLISLNLQHNSIEFGNKQPLSHLHSLKELYLDFNELYEINPDIFYNLSKLEFLSISENNIQKMDSYFLRDLSMIQILDFSNNNLSSMSDINIASSTLIKLIGQNCSINKSLVKESLLGNINLEYVDFSSNKLVGVDSYAMHELSNLKTLNLSNNMLQYLKEYAFSSLYNLKSLDLKNNRLSLITESSFLNLTNLKYLDLSGNMLQAVLREYTRDLSSLEKVNLQRNNIKIITPGTFFSSPNLQELFVGGNALDCTCELSYFASYLINNSHIKIDDANAVMCASPPAVRGTQLINVDFISMNCEPDDPDTVIDDKGETDYDYDYESTETSTNSTFSTVSSIGVELITDKMSTVNLSLDLFTDASTTLSFHTTDDITLNTQKSTASSMNSTSFSTENSTEIELITDQMSTLNSSLDLFTDVSTTLSFLNTDDATPSTQNITTTTSNSTAFFDVEDKEISTNIPLSSSKNTVVTTDIPTEITTVPAPVNKTLNQSSDTFESVTDPVFSMKLDEADLSINILDYSVLVKDFCIRWSISGLTSDVPTCSVKINSIKGRKLKNLKCPTEGNEIRQCIGVEGVYDFCINVYVGGIRKSKNCSKVEMETTSTQYTLETTSASSEIISTFYDTTELNERFTTNSLSTLKTTKSSSSGKVVPFKIKTFDVILSDTSSSALVAWTVSKSESKLVCNLTLILSTNHYNQTKGIFKCDNNSFKIENIEDQETIRICLLSNHESYTADLTCKSSPGLSYKLRESRTKDHGYKNSSLIALICLLVVVVIIIIVIILKNLLKKRTESDRYNVYAQEQIVQKRMSSQIPQEPCVRYSYTLKDQAEI